MFPSEQRKQITSTIQIFPAIPSGGAALPLNLLAGASATLTKVSLQNFSATRASPTVAVAGSDLSGGLPMHRSDTSLQSKLTAMHVRGCPWREKDQEAGVDREIDEADEKKIEERI